MKLIKLKKNTFVEAINGWNQKKIKYVGFYLKTIRLKYRQDISGLFKPISLQKEGETAQVSGRRSRNL